MEWSNFILNIDENNKVLLFNTYNKATVLLNIEDYREINSYLINKNSECNKNYIESLKKLGFLIEDKSKERIKFCDDISNFSNKSETYNIVVLTTTSCNFKCSYCYENGIFRGDSFRNVDINKIIVTIDNFINKRKIKKIQLTLFGGEPTLNWEFAIELLRKIDTYCKNKGIELGTDIITNGYLLDNEKVNILLKYNVTNIQITLDGKADIHDSRRMLLNGDKTFNKIIQNISNILQSEVQSLTIRINYDRENASRVLELVDFLDMMFSRYKQKIKLTFGRIDSNLVNDNDSSILDNDEELQKFYLSFYKKVFDAGFKQEKYFETGSLCMSKKDNSIIISPDNNIYKCLSLVGIKEGIVAQFPIKESNSNIKNYFNLSLYDKCFEKKCEFIPMCHTGCKFKSFIKYGDLNLQACEYKLLKKINTSILKTLYKL